MDIKINLKIFLFAAIFYLTGQINIYGICMLFAVLHELGHLLAGLFTGFRIRSIKIMPLGLSIKFSIFPKEYNNKVLKGKVINFKKILIALAGPITNIVLAVLIYYKNISIFGISCEHIIYVNVLIAIFNMIPIYPLDGGRILKNICKLFFGLKRATTYTNTTANITIILLTMISSVAIYYFENISILFIIIYLWMLVLMENRKYNIKVNMYKIIESGKRKIEEEELMIKVK